MIQGNTEPRIFTPPARKLTPKTSHGFAAIKFAEDMLHIKLFPWQEWLLIHALELTPDGLYRFRTVCVSVSRQNGKTLLEIVLALWHIYALESRTVIGTAQDLANSERAWKDAVAFAEDDSDLAEMIQRVYYGHPKELLLSNGCEYRVAAASRRGARGFSGDLVLLDELREHSNWDSWAAVSMTMNARPRSQAWAFSNAGDVMSVVLRYLRASAHRDLGWPDGDADADVLGEQGGTDLDDVDLDLSMGWFEWSAPQDAKRNDLKALAQANPGMNHFEITPNCITERSLMSALRTSPPHVYDVECMCRWVTLAGGGPFPESSWADTVDPDAVPASEAKIVVCVEVSHKRNQTYITRAGLTDDDVAVVGVWVDRAGTDWVTDFLVAQQDSYSALVVRTVSGSPVLSLLSEMQDANLPVIEWKSTDIGTAHDQLFDRLRDKAIRHLPHGGLDMAATSAMVKLQPSGGWVIDILKSPSDTAPLLAAMGAVWGLEAVEDQYSVYADDGYDVLVLRPK